MREQGLASYADILSERASKKRRVGTSKEENPIVRWAEDNRILANGDPYRVSIHPPFRGIYDAVLDFSGKAKIVAFQKGSQIGATEFLINTICYCIDVYREGILALMETESKCRTMMRERLAPQFNREPLKSVIRENLEKGARGSMYSANYEGGSLNLYGSNSASSFSSITSRFVFLDEFARMPSSVRGEGDPLALMRGRMSTFNERGKLLVVSTPVDPYLQPGSFSQIINSGNKQLFMVPCLHCGEFYDWTMEPGRETFRKGIEHGSVVGYHVCPHCKGRADEGDKKEMMERGHWQATRELGPEDDCVSFTLPSFYSHAMAWAEIAKEAIHVDKNRGQPKPLYNTRYGLPYDEGVQPPKPQETKEKFSLSYMRGEVPKPVLFLTTSCDVQKGWMRHATWGWGRDRRSFLIDYGRIDHAVDSEKGRRELSNLFYRKYPVIGGGAMGVAVAAIDAGFMNSSVMDFVADYVQPIKTQVHWALPSFPCVFPIRGSPAKNQVSVVHAVGKGKRQARTGAEISVIYAGANLCKTELHGVLNQVSEHDVDDIENTARPGLVFFPKDAELAVFEEIAAEELRVSTTAKGVVSMEWHQNRPRNEMLDCWVYCRVCAELAGIANPDEEYLNFINDQTYFPGEDLGHGVSEDTGEYAGMTYKEAMAKAREQDANSEQTGGETELTYTEAMRRLKAEDGGGEYKGKRSDLWNP